MPVHCEVAETAYPYIHHAYNAQKLYEKLDHHCQTHGNLQPPKTQIFQVPRHKWQLRGQGTS
eukprot:2357211-Amphidinium_carterae.1